MTQLTFELCLYAMIVTGFYCASKLDHSHPLWIRLFTLSPSLMAMLGLYFVYANEYVAYAVDIGLAISQMLQSLIVASRFSDRPWLDIRVKTNEVVE
jgi:hypothetical protein